jgi:hypothetical protein
MGCANSKAAPPPPFEEYVASSGVADEYLFYTEAQQFRINKFETRADMSKAAKAIYEKFMVPNKSPHEIWLQPRCLAEVRSKLNLAKPPQALFTSACNEVRSVLLPQWIEYCKKFKVDFHDGDFEMLTRSQ